MISGFKRSPGIAENMLEANETSDDHESEAKPQEETVVTVAKPKKVKPQ